LEGKPIGLDPKQTLKERLWFREPKCKLRSKVHFFIFLLFSNVLFYPCCSNYERIEEMLWIEDIVESTQAPSFLTNSRVDLVGFVDPHNVVARRSAFSTLPSAHNGGELEGGAKSRGLKCQFSQVEGIWIARNP
jgi:hypothetical protein